MNEPVEPTPVPEEPPQVETAAPNSRLNSMNTIWPTFDAVSPSALVDNVPEEDDLPELVQPGVTSPSPEPNSKLIQHLFQRSPRPSNRLSKTRKPTAGRDCHSRQSDRFRHTSASPSVQQGDDGPTGRTKMPFLPAKSLLRCQSATFSLVPRVDHSPRAGPRISSCQHGIHSSQMKGRRPASAPRLDKVTMSPVVTVYGDLPQPQSVDPTPGTVAPSPSKRRPGRGDVLDPYGTKDNVFSTPPQIGGFMPSLISAGTACESWPASSERASKVTSATGWSNPFRSPIQSQAQSPVKRSGTSASVGTVSRASPTGYLSRSRTVGMEGPSSTRNSAHPSGPDDLAARVQVLERENRLLEAALMAVIRTNGKLNGCSCSAGRKGITMSALHRSILSQTSPDDPALPLHPYYNPAYNTPPLEKRASMASNRTESSTYSCIPSQYGHGSVGPVPPLMSTQHLNTSGRRHQQGCRSGPKGDVIVH